MGSGVIAIKQEETMEGDGTLTDRTMVRTFQNGVAPSANDFARVNGCGQWSAWQRNFKSPLLALLDLFDNAIDASLVTTEESLHFRSRGRIQVTADHIPSGPSMGICMINNCHSRIPPIKEVLEIFRSNKCAQDIGQNGIGIKQACASLTDTSFIITRNEKQVSVGVIAAALQREEGCVLPHINLHSDMDYQQFTECVCASHSFVEIVQEYGNGCTSTGLQRLWDHCKGLGCGSWAADNHVFCVLLHKLRHGAGSNSESLSSDDEEGVDYGLRAESLMNKLADALPRHYIHIPADFNININHSRIRFQYWERRLVELTSFSCKIDPKNDWVKAKDWLDPNDGNNLRIYCGFDPARVLAGGVGQTSVLSLYVYSRHSGRLICVEEDARNTLNLTNSGTDFGQGLTVILDDYLSALPLTPTKQGLGFAEETTDGVHEKNLYAWLGAYTANYYKYHLENFSGLKGRLTDEVASHLEQIQRLRDRDNINSFMLGNFTTFKGTSWQRHKMTMIRRKARGSIAVVRGPDSLINLNPPPPTPKPSPRVSTSKKRKLPNNRAVVPAADAEASGPPVHDLMVGVSQPSATTRPQRGSNDSPNVSSLSHDNDESSMIATPPSQEFASLDCVRGSRANYHIPRKGQRVERQVSQSTDHTELEKKNAELEEMVKKLGAKLEKCKEKREKYKESLSEKERICREKDDELAKKEVELAQIKEDLDLSEQFRATLEQQNAVLKKRLEHHD